jgi:hypothetical protein
LALHGSDVERRRVYLKKEKGIKYFGFEFDYYSGQKVH